MNDGIDENELRQQYADLRPELEKWGEWVDSRLRAYLKSLQWTSARIQIWPKHRYKEPDSFLDKALNRKKEYDNPLLQIQDKVATRVVLLKQCDVDELSNYIKSSEEWVYVKESKNIEELKELHPEEFSYLSNHHIIRPSVDYPTQVDRELLTCEIQVRTLMQHAYAEVSHDTLYKNHGITDNPKAKRCLASLASFAEASDEKIMQVYSELQSRPTLEERLKHILISLYQQFVPTYDRSRYDAAVSNVLFAVYRKEDLEEAENELRAFCEKKKQDIEPALKPGRRENTTLFGHPIVLLAFYGIKNLQETTKHHWPYTHNALIDTLHAMGYSDEILYG